LATTERLCSSILGYGIFQPGGKPVYEGQERGYSDAEAIALCKAISALMEFLKGLQVFDSAGNQQRIRRIGIDCGYFTETVRSFVKANQITYPWELYTTKGYASKDFAEARKGMHGEGWKCEGLGSTVYVNACRTRELWQLGLLLPLGSPTGVDINGSSELHKELALQLSAEQLVLKAEDTKGRIQYSWICKGRNDIADALGIARVMAEMGGATATAGLTPALPSPSPEPSSEQPKTEAKRVADDIDLSGWNNW
jgi:hypothetical protein